MAYGKAGIIDTQAVFDLIGRGQVNVSVKVYDDAALTSVSTLYATNNLSGGTVGNPFTTNSVAMYPVVYAVVGDHWVQATIDSVLQSAFKIHVRPDASDVMLQTRYDPLSYGAVWDGASHPLSTRYGSLAAAQAVYPHATALTDEIDWAALQAAINAAQTAGSGTVWIHEGTGYTNKTAAISASNITLDGPGTIKFVPTAPFVGAVNDRPINVGGAQSARRQIAAGAIAKGATSFTAQSAGDTADLVAGDWLIIGEFDPNAGTSVGDYVLVDWVQVRSVAGTTVNTIHPFRTAFPNARTWATSPRGGLSFSRVLTLVENTKLRNFSVRQPAVAQSNPSVCATVAKGLDIESLTIDNAFGQAYFVTVCKDVALRNPLQKDSGIAQSEIAATVDFDVVAPNMGMIADANNSNRQSNTGTMTIDAGSAYFRIIGGCAPNPADQGFTFRAAHDGVVLGFFLGWVRRQTGGQGCNGFVMTGCQGVALLDFIAAGGDTGVAASGVVVGDTTDLAVNILSQDNIIRPTYIGPFPSGAFSAPGSLNKDLYILPAGADLGLGGKLRLGDVGNLASALAVLFQAKTNADVNDFASWEATGAAARRIVFGPGTGGTNCFGFYDANAAQVLLKLIYATGALSARGQIYPGDEAGGVQAAGGLLHSAGVPNNTNGNNNDWCVSDNGHLYFKTAGSWVQKV